MKHTYSIQGMTCNACVDKITEALCKINGVVKVDVSLSESIVTIEMAKHISQQAFDDSLRKIGPYILSSERMAIDHSMTTKPKRPIKDFLPIIVIAAIIIIFTTVMAIFVNPSFEFGMRMFMGGFFAIFGAFKVFNLRKFADAYQTYDIVAKRSRAYAYVYPFLEVLLAVLYFADFGGIARNIFAFALMVVSTIGVVQKIRQKEEVPCACLGMVFVLPMTWVTLFEDVLMALEALFMVLMTIGFQLISLPYTEHILGLHLRFHTTAEWVQFSALGHWTLGGFLILAALSTWLIRRSYSCARLVQKASAVLIFLGGLALAVGGFIDHIDQGSIILELLTDPRTQWFQHAIGGVMLMIAAIAMWKQTKQKVKAWLWYVPPAAICITGVVFFFHQQLGAANAVIPAMWWHMIFGGLMVIGTVAWAFDYLFRKEQKGFFVVGTIAILFGALMMVTYQEPQGAYELAVPSSKDVAEQQILDLQQRWSFW